MIAGTGPAQQPWAPRARRSAQPGPYLLGAEVVQLFQNRQRSPPHGQVMFQRNGGYALIKVSNKLKGVLPQSPTLTMDPKLALREIASMGTQRWRRARSGGLGAPPRAAGAGRVMAR